MTKTVITSDKAPAAIGPYSQAIKAGNTVYMSGQIPLDPSTMELVEGIEAQITQVFENLKSVAEAAGGSFKDIVKLNIFLTDLGHFAKVNELMSTYFTQPYPARAAIGVAALPRGAGLKWTRFSSSNKSPTERALRSVLPEGRNPLCAPRSPSRCSPSFWAAAPATPTAIRTAPDQPDRHRRRRQARQLASGAARQWPQSGVENQLQGQSGHLLQWLRARRRQDRQRCRRQAACRFLWQLLRRPERQG